MKFKSNDPLQALLREALHKQKVEVSAKPKSLNSGPDPQDLYTSTNWKPGRIVALEHVAGSTRTFLGMFQEHINDRAKGKRFVPLPPGNYIAVTVEVVHGDYWLQTQSRPAYNETPEEVRSLRERFQELLESYN